jgi:hypothetical protein
VLYLPWVPVILRQTSEILADYWIERPDRQTLWNTYFAFIASTPPAHGWGMDPLSRGARWGIIVLLGFGLVSAIPRLPRIGLITARTSSACRLLALVVAGPTLLAILVSAWLVPVFTVRYAAFVLPLFWLLVARGVMFLPMPLLRGLAGATVMAAVAMNLAPLYTDPFYGRADLRTAAFAVTAMASPGDLVVHSSPFTQYPFAYYDKDVVRDVVLDGGDGPGLERATDGSHPFWYVVSYGVQDPTAGSVAAQEAMCALRAWDVMQRYDFAGVLVYRVSRDGRATELQRLPP